MKLRALGVDAAFANMGFASVTIEVGLGGVFVECTGLDLIKTAGEDKKVVRKASDELRRARILHSNLQAYCRDRQLAFVEVPSGSQSASAARSLGIAVGVLASCPVPIIEVSPMEVKAVVVGRSKGTPNPTKAEMIAWAVKMWPKAPWRRERKSGRLVADNEHLADALATVMAGITTPAFQNLLALNHEISIPPSVRPAPKQRTILRI